MIDRLLIDRLFNWDWRPAVRLTDGRILAVLDDETPDVWTELGRESADDVVGTAGG